MHICFDQFESLFVELFVDVLAVRYEFHVLRWVDLTGQTIALGSLLLGQELSRSVFGHVSLHKFGGALAAEAVTASVWHVNSLLSNRVNHWLFVRAFQSYAFAVGLLDSDVVEDFGLVVLDLGLGCCSVTHSQSGALARVLD